MKTKIFRMLWIVAPLLLTGCGRGGASGYALMCDTTYPSGVYKNSTLIIDDPAYAPAAIYWYSTSDGGYAGRGTLSEKETSDQTYIYTEYYAPADIKHRLTIHRDTLQADYGAGTMRYSCRKATSAEITKAMSDYNKDETIQADQKRAQLGKNKI
jgi:hypothetical protein